MPPQLTGRSALPVWMRFLVGTSVCTYVFTGCPSGRSHQPLRRFEAGFIAWTGFYPERTRRSAVPDVPDVPELRRRTASPCTGSAGTCRSRPPGPRACPARYCWPFARAYWVIPRASTAIPWASTAVSRPAQSSPGPGQPKGPAARQLSLASTLGPRPEGRCGRRLLGEWHNAAPAERYSAKAFLDAARGTQPHRPNTRNAVPAPTVPDPEIFSRFLEAPGMGQERPRGARGSGRSGGRAYGCEPARTSSG